MQKWPCNITMKELSSKAEILCASTSYDTYDWLVRVSIIISTDRGVIRGHKDWAISKIVVAEAYFGGLLFLI